MVSVVMMCVIIAFAIFVIHYMMNPVSSPAEFSAAEVDGKLDDKWENELKEWKENVKMEEQKQSRFRSWAVWASIAGAVWIVLQATGLAEDWGIQQTAFTQIVNAIGTILVGFGILNNPTDKLNF